MLRLALVPGEWHTPESIAIELGDRQGDTAVPRFGRWKSLYIWFVPGFAVRYHSWAGVFIQGSK